MGWLFVLGGLGLAILVTALAASNAADGRREWAVRNICPGCDRRYRPWQGNRFFLPFMVCPKCGTDKEDFSRGVCRLVDGEWQDREDAERVAKALMNGE